MDQEFSPFFVESVDGAEYELVVGDGPVLAPHRDIAGVRPGNNWFINTKYYNFGHKYINKSSILGGS